MGRIRKLRDGTEVAVTANDGIRKICRCPRTKWKGCKHPWYFNYQWKGEPYRFNLNRHLGKPKDGLAKSEAERQAEKIRIAIRDGNFNKDAAVVEPKLATVLTFEQFAEHWKREKGCQLVRPEDNDYRIRTICEFRLADGRRFGDLDVRTITSSNIEMYRKARKAAGLSVVTVNHDLKLLRKMWNWGIRVKLEAERQKQEHPELAIEIPVYGLTGTPFRVAGVACISLEKETPRAVRFSSADDEDRLLALADPRMEAFITTMLDTCCRPGELRSLQWREVNLKSRTMFVLPGKSKTGVGRKVRLSARVTALLELRQFLPDGERMPSTGYVFGNEVGEEMSKETLRNAWERLRTKAARVWEETEGEKGVDLNGLHLADLRHEAASRYDELDVPTAQIKEILGHANLSTTNRYVNPSARAIQRAVDKLDAAHLANSLQKTKTAESKSNQHTDNDLPVSNSRSAA